MAPRAGREGGAARWRPGDLSPCRASAPRYLAHLRSGLPACHPAPPGRKHVLKFRSPPPFPFCPGLPQPPRFRGFGGWRFGRGRAEENGIWRGRKPSLLQFSGPRWGGDTRRCTCRGAGSLLPAPSQAGLNRGLPVRSSPPPLPRAEENPELSKQTQRNSLFPTLQWQLTAGVVTPLYKRTNQTKKT